MTIIPPTILKGTRDFLPSLMQQRLAARRTLERIFLHYGYAPIETPILNPAETILGKYGDEGDRLTYHFADNGGREVALPYDLTVSFARFVAAHWRELPMPFKRYQIQRVWRAEKPQKGRLREFYQCDIDIIGTTSLTCEAEILRVIYNVFSSLNVKNFVIQINSRRLMNTVLKDFGVIEAQVPAVIRSIDKLEKIGVTAIITELQNLGVVRASDLMALLQSDISAFSNYDTSELTTVMQYAQALGIPEQYIKVVPTLARGLDYYTGLVIETVVPDSGLGSVCGGGRYDNLCGTFCDQHFSGVGVSFGFERIMLLLEQQPLPTPSQLATQALVTVFDGNSTESALTIYRTLLENDINCEMYFQPDKLQKQLKYANQKQIPFVVIQGSDELTNEAVTVKHMQAGTQKTIPQNQLVEYIKGFYV